MKKRAPIARLRRAGRGQGIADIAQDLGVSMSVLRPFVESGELVPDQYGRILWPQVVAVQRAHPEVFPS